MTVYKWSAVPSYEKHNTRREWFDSHGKFRASVTLQCAVEDRFNLVCDLYTSQMGPTLPNVGGSPNPQFVGYAPRAYPDPGVSANSYGSILPPTMNRIGVTSATIRSWEEIASTLGEGEDEVMDYKSSAFVEVQYGRLWSIEETIEFDTEVVTQSYLDFQWKFAEKPKDKKQVHELEVPVVTMNTAIITREFIGLAPKHADSGPLVPDFQTLHENVGHTNPEEWTSKQLGMTFKKGTLLMLEPDVKPGIDMQNLYSTNNFGANGFTVKVKFLYRPGNEPGMPTRQGLLTDTTVDTHNLFWRPRMHVRDGTQVTRGGWDRLQIKDPDTQEANYDDYTPFTYGAEIKGSDTPGPPGWLVDAVAPLLAT